MPDLLSTFSLGSCHVGRRCRGSAPLWEELCVWKTSRDVLWMCSFFHLFSIFFPSFLLDFCPLPSCSSHIPWDIDSTFYNARAQAYCHKTMKEHQSSLIICISKQEEVQDMKSWNPREKVCNKVIQSFGKELDKDTQFLLWQL